MLACAVRDRVGRNDAGERRKDSPHAMEPTVELCHRHQALLAARRLFRQDLYRRRQQRGGLGRDRDDHQTFRVALHRYDQLTGLEREQIVTGRNGGAVLPEHGVELDRAGAHHPADIGLIDRQHCAWFEGFAPRQRLKRRVHASTSLR